MKKIKLFFFKTCPKSGRIRGLRTDGRIRKAIFPAIGLLALLWFLFRVVPKPSRMLYPCQQAALPIALSFIAWISASSLGVLIVKHSQIYFNKKRWMLAAAICLLGLIVFGFGQVFPNASLWANILVSKDGLLTFKSNEPIGTAKGIYPGRVTWVRDTTATPWDGKTGKWWEEKNINEKALAKMVSSSLKALTGEKEEKKAWKRLFEYYNETHGRGKRGWKAGELVAVKINVNNTYEASDVDNDIDQSPQATRALLHQLIDIAGIAQKDIMVYDASVGWKIRALPDRIYKPLHAEFPQVRWMDGPGSPGREKPEWVANAITYTSPEVELGNELPKAVVESQYLINIALFKGHEFAGVTLCAKNHFGSIRYPQKDHGKYVTQMNGEKGDYSAFVDLMGCPNLGGKTMLYIVDGLYGMQTNIDAPQKPRDLWKHLFNGQWSASYFMSQDPVAIESVCLDFLFTEFQQDLGMSGAPWSKKGSSRNCDNYLIEAANGTNAKYGDYKPNGKKIGSLGVQEHWNNAKDKQYSRNLGRGKGIELVRIGDVK